MERTVYRFDDVEVDSSRGCLSFRGEERHLRQKAYQVLIYLLEHREQLVSKDELFGTVWPNTAVTDDVLVQCVKEIRRAIEDDPHKPRYIKTVPKAGYRFIGEVSRETSKGSNGYMQKAAVVIEPQAAPLPVRRPILRWGLAFVLTIGVLLTLGLYFEWPKSFFAQGRYSLRADAGKTVAVIAIENRSGNAELDWLREGLADMLVVGLSRSQGLSLIDRSRLHELAARSEQKGDAITAEAGTEIARRARRYPSSQRADRRTSTFRKPDGG
jgi:DNA-binding winged helix-turn-helix (wHTH) protein